MTETEWQSRSHPNLLLVHLARRGPGSARKYRLMMTACCRDIPERFGEGTTRRALEAAERYADGLARPREVRESRRVATTVLEWVLGWREDDVGLWLSSGVDPAPHFEDDDTSWVVHGCPALVLTWLLTEHLSERPTRHLLSALRAVAIGDGREEQLATRQSDIIRDVFGNPFRPGTLDPSWRTDTAVALARQMYDSREFSAMPILADALMDAGCHDEELLNHLRGPGPHTRGCWAVDAVLGKT